MYLRFFNLVPKLPFGNALDRNSVSDSPAKQSLAESRSQTGVWERGKVTTPPGSRRGLVLVAVLIVVVLLSLAAYNYADVMTAEYKRSDYAVRYAQAKASAEAGIHYVALIMANELSGSAELLGGNPYDNSQYFQGILVAANDSARNNGRFSIYAMHYEDPASGISQIGTPGPAHGVFDEASKININALMIADSSGNTLYNWLMQLPNIDRKSTRLNSSHSSISY